MNGRRCSAWPPVLVAALLVGGPDRVGAVDEVNRFNRLLQQSKSGEIYDSSTEASDLLQKSGEAFAPLPKTRGGNGVDWTNALHSGKIEPLSDLNDPAAEPVIMDLNIVREVKGSMPDVVFPHKQHTELLDCANCHPAIFIPQKGANQMSMAANLLGKQCGVCHGKVAFPFSRCVACHSKKKQHAAQEVREWVVQ